MTGPQPTPGTQDIQLLVSSGAAPGPDGKPWVALSLQYGLTVVQILLPEDLAAQAGPGIAARLAEGVAAAKRARLGIVLPGESGAAVPLAASSATQPWPRPSS